MVPLLQVKEIIIHCTANRPGCKMTMADFRRLHRARGFQDVGYHYIIFEDGRIEAGRSLKFQGAHCSRGGHNRFSIGIAYVGGIDEHGVTKDTRTPEQRAALDELIDYLRNLYGNVPVFGHRDFDRTKVCPCFNAHAEYSSSSL